MGNVLLQLCSISAKEKDVEIKHSRKREETKKEVKFNTKDKKGTHILWEISESVVNRK